MLKFSTLLDLLQTRAEDQAQQTAYTFLMNGEAEAASLTYWELQSQAKAIAASLQSISNPGERALLLYPSGLEFIAAFFGCVYAGILAVPAYPPRRNRNSSRLEAIIADAQASVVLINTSLLTQIKSRFAENPKLASIRWLNTDDIPLKLAFNWKKPEVEPENTAFLQYTSGSTAVPKGVMVTHQNILHNEKMIQAAFGNTKKTIVLGWLPLFHDMGLIGNVLQPLYLGVPSILMSPVAFLQKPVRWLQAISRYHATTSGGPNFAYDLCVKKITSEQLNNCDLSSWEIAFNGAETIHAETLEKFATAFEVYGFRRKAFYPCYGMAETTLLVSGRDKYQKLVTQRIKTRELEQNLIEKCNVLSSGTKVLVGCGRPYIDTTISIVNTESLTRCEIGQVGEIWVSGKSIATGYWNRPLATQETFQAYMADSGEGPFLRTGDLGFKLNGELYVTGRLKDVIIVRGRNYYPQDIEFTVENSHPALRSHFSAAFYVERSGEERLVLACEVERTYLKNLNIEEVVKRLRKTVGEKHDLQLYAVVLLKTGSIPKTSSGKIQRYACKTGFLDGSLDVVKEWTIDLVKTELPPLQTVSKMQLNRGENEVTKQLDLNLTKSTKDLSVQKLVLTKEQIEAWLVSNLACNLNMLPDKIDVSKSFADYGLDSSIAVSITGDLAEWLGYEIEPTLFWEYPNIKAVTQYLAEESQLNS
jgi:acyl-CoA synthetase (AMP-forming)/AMP-acid ligase II/acyl carrier protein